MEKLPVWVSTTKHSNVEAEASFTPQAEFALEHLPLQRLRENLGDLCHAITSILGDIRGVSTFRLQEATVRVEIAAEGKVNLIGTSIRGGQGAITLKFAE